MWLTFPASRLMILLCLALPCRTALSQVERTPIDRFLNLGTDRVDEELAAIRENWHPGDSVMLLEVLRIVRSKDNRMKILKTLETQTGQTFGSDRNAWFRWVWKQESELHSDYAEFKSKLYSYVDPRFKQYFQSSGDLPTRIRLDEIRWGGVKQNGIPPLDHPLTISAKSANYLADSDIVFGVVVNGIARAYPKRILAWHEMVKDEIGGKNINGVYCTLCGAMIVYETKLESKSFDLGTSGFLYRSNKLMFDAKTQSLWSTIRGEPVVGSLVGQNIKLNTLSVVTSTWGAWRERHPKTDVLSLETGFRRDYGEGVAYKKYFATDQLMFTVPKLDNRLGNKEEILVVRQREKTPFAISAKLLSETPVLSFDGLTIVTDKSGANRVYSTGNSNFTRWKDANLLESADGNVYRQTEEALVAAKQLGLERFPRVPAHRAFWFGWYAAHPETRLITQVPK